VTKQTIQNVLAAACCLTCGILVQSLAAETHRPFSVRDDIEITQFGYIYGIKEDVVLAPAGDKVLVHTAGASLRDGKVHEELRIYDMSRLSTFVNASTDGISVAPEWRLEESTKTFGDQDEPIITNIRWLSDESGIAFLLRLKPNHARLCLANLNSTIPTLLSSAGDNVLGFAIRDNSHYVFVAASRETKGRLTQASTGPYQVGTGKPLWDVMLPEQMVKYIRRGKLWAATGGRPSPLKNPATGRPIALYEIGNEHLALSPDGKTLVTILPVSSIPKEWESLYPPPFPNKSIGIKAGTQDLAAVSGWGYAGEYSAIALDSGKITSLTNAPEAIWAGWTESLFAQPEWSKDGSRVLLPGTFIFDPTAKQPRPCIAVVLIGSGSAECVRQLHRELANGYEAGYERMDVAEFEDGRDDRVILKHFNHIDNSGDVEKTYIGSGNGMWQAEEQVKKRIENTQLQVKVKANFKDSPVLVATDTVTRKSRVVFDPNPQLKGVALGDAELYNWDDRTGRKWQGILYKPVGYREGVRYPLVLQNHGFSVDRFVPSGGFPSAFVAQELASAGIMVLQVRDCAGENTSTEGPCNVEGYEAAVDKLSKDGLVESSRVGIIGFSRTVFYVLEALTTSSLHFEAASITDGINLGYMEYLCNGPDNAFTRMDEAMIGSAPTGSGLHQWLRNSPVFNMDKVSAPLRVVARRGDGVLEMWEPYALLEAMHKPVDLIVLNTEQHVISDPTIRLVAQNGNVDWFCFWLQGYEDPDPAKKDQYKRWEHLRELRDADDKAMEQLRPVHRSQIGDEGPRRSTRNR